jgi:hypothetical protein
MKRIRAGKAWSARESGSLFFESYGPRLTKVIVKAGRRALSLYPRGHSDEASWEVERVGAGSAPKKGWAWEPG